MPTIFYWTAINFRRYYLYYRLSSDGWIIRITNLTSVPMAEFTVSKTVPIDQDIGGKQLTVIILQKIFNLKTWMKENNPEI
jgi:hypothetical protein